MYNKTLVFDMDGTIADLYHVEHWLEGLRSEQVFPYVEAKPLCDMDTLNALLHMLHMIGWRICVTSWLAKGSSKEYAEKVRKAKKEWLDKYHFPYDELHFVQYGRTKADCTRHHGGYQILVDDVAKIRQGWTLGDTIDATQNITKAIADLLFTEI